MTLFPAQFILSSDAVSNLASLIMIVVILGSLLSGREKSPATWWLLGYLSGLAGLMGAMLVVNTMALPGWMPVQGLGALFGSACLIQFAYSFPRPLPAQAKEARLVLAMSGCAFLVALGMLAVWSFVWINPVAMRMITVGLSVTQFAWAVVILIRHTVDLTVQQLGHGAGLRLSRVWAALARPAGREAQATRAFVLAAFSPMLIAIWVALYYAGIVPGALYDLGFDLSLLAFPFLFAMIYLNYALEPTTFMLKLTLSTLVMVLAVLSIVSQITLSYFETSYKQARMADVQQVERALLSSKLSDSPTAVAFVISRDPGDEQPPAYTLHLARDERFDLHYVNAKGLGLMPTLPVSQAGPGNDSFYYHSSFEWNGREYIVGFPVATYAAALNPHALPIVYVMLGSVVLVLLVMPLFFRVSLVRPLDALLEGVRQVNAGNKNVVVPIQHTDEIGFLTETFNRMVVSVRQAEELQVLRKEIAVAHNIQSSLLPQAAPDIPGLDIAAASLPAREVGGDLYTYYSLPGGGYGLAIGDVTGKGIPAALYMAVSTTMLEAKAPFVPDVAQLLGEMNVALFPHMQPNRMNMALCCVRLEPAGDSYTAHIANAGMVAPILRRGAHALSDSPVGSRGRPRECEYLDVGGMPVGTTRTGSPYRALALPLQRGDMLVLSSDGIVEAMNPANEMYGFERLLARIHAAPGHTAREIQEWVLADVHTFVGKAEPHDDMTLIVMIVRDNSKGEG